MESAILFAELEIGLHRLAAESWQVQLRYRDPASEADVPPENGPAALDLQSLLTLRQDARSYGAALAAQLFTSQRVRDLYSRAKTAAEASGRLLRLRLLVGPTAPELHGLRWELLCDPETGAPLATSERILFSRFMVSQDWRPVKLRAKAALKALIAIAAPRDLDLFRLAAIDGDAEIERASEGLRGIRTVVVGREEPLTLDRLAAQLRAEGQGIDILYLVCHGALARGESPYLYLQDDDGNTVRIPGAALAERLRELPELPRLVVLASCESQGTADGATQAALAPLLAEAGVPALVSMQGQITMDTVAKLMPVFFSELGKDGQIDRAFAVARGAVRERPDFWMPVLNLRLKSGRIWYEPGFAGEPGDFTKWRSICQQVRTGRFIPILGPDLGAAITGTTQELASRIAVAEHFPLAAHEHRDLAKVTQYLTIDQDRGYAQGVVLAALRSQILERTGDLPVDAAQGQIPRILDSVVASRSGDETFPYHILARLQASIYINASAETLLVKSLRSAGRQPVLVASDWRSTKQNDPCEPRVDDPTPLAPLVYHVFGVYGQPDSLVLTEDDFLDYLITTSTYKLIPRVVRGSLTESSLLFLGFPLGDWSFRILFRLIMTLEGCHALKGLSHVGVQVHPDEHSLGDVERARKYLESYFAADRGAGRGRGEPRIDIYWGSAADFLQELHAQLAERENEKAPPASMGESDAWH